MKKSFILVMVMCFLLSVCALVSAEVPKTINFQGRLTDKDGKPLAGSYSLKFSLYEAASGGSPLWIEEQTVALSNGLYNCLLGAITPLNLTFEQPYYLEISIASLGFSTRQKLSSTPYALNSERLGGFASTSFIHTDSQGRVGIGTTSPRYKLEVIGTMKGALIASNTNPVGLEFNLLFNAPNRYLVSQSGAASFSLDMLFDATLVPSYSTNGPSPANPQVILIENLPATHTQAGAWVGWTTRYWPPQKFKIEGYDTYQSANTWRVFADYSTTSYAGADFLIPVAPGGTYTKLRLTIYEGSGQRGANGNKRVGLSEIFFLHPEATRVYAGLLPASLWEVNGKVGIGTTTPNYNLTVGNGTASTNMGLNSSSSAWYYLQKNSTDKFACGFRDTTDTFAIAAKTSSWQDALSVSRSSGNVGIGTTNPQGKLHVDVDNVGRLVLSNAAGIANNEDAGGLAWRYSNGTGTVAANILLLGNSNSTADGTARLAFGVRSNTGATANIEQLTLQSTGNVGIGTTTPQEKLQVNGKVKAKEFITGDITFTDPKTEKPLWRMFEDEQGLYLKSATTGKVYKFVLEEVKK